MNAQSIFLLGLVMAAALFILIRQLRRPSGGCSGCGSSGGGGSACGHCTKMRHTLS